MKATCLINNYNYENYVCEAIESALSQTHPFDEIIVIDDASTDGSINLLQEKYGSNSSIKIIIQEKNQGQLAAITAGFLLSTGNVIFCLDADDLYHPQYLEIALSIYKSYPNCGFLHSKMGIFDCLKQNYQPPSHEQIEQFSHYIRDCGYSIILTLEEQRFVGSASSGNSIHRDYLSEILPCTCIGDYRLWTDNCVVFGSSILGARKFFIDLQLVAYRSHGNNGFMNSSNSYIQNRFKFYQNQVALTRLFNYLSQKNNLTGDLISRNAIYEFKTIDYPTWDLFFAYLRIMMRSPSSIPHVPLGLLNKFYGLGIMLKHMLARNY
jgi:glycosyltransferase involved in cell wall biosynthesis